MKYLNKRLNHINFNPKGNKPLVKYFERNSVVDLVTKYELYYHISLGNYVFETLLNADETSKKLEDLKLEVSVDIALFNICGIILKHFEEINSNEELEIYIRKEASLHALNDFIDKDKELMNSKFYKKIKKEEVIKDNFFNERMKQNFEMNYPLTYQYYDLTISDRFIKDVQKKVLKV